MSVTGTRMKSTRCTSSTGTIVQVLSRLNCSGAPRRTPRARRRDPDRRRRPGRSSRARAARPEAGTRRSRQRCRPLAGDDAHRLGLGITRRQIRGPVAVEVADDDGQRIAAGCVVALSPNVPSPVLSRPTASYRGCRRRQDPAPCRRSGRRARRSWGSGRSRYWRLFANVPSPALSSTDDRSEDGCP